MKPTRLAFAALFISMVAAAGCELIAKPDRTQIPGSSGGGGAGGNTTSSTGGGAPECTDASQCPAPKEACVAATCEGGQCDAAPLAKGTKTTQVKGNCQKEQCDGKGNVEKVADDTDVPNDGNDCTNDVCDHGAPANSPKAEGAPCGAGGKLQCDGAGKCVTCTMPTDCGTDDGCKAFNCDKGACKEIDVAAGMPATSGQTTGDCQVIQCDGHGVAKSVDDNSDKPVDGKECTQDLCAAGVPSNPPVDPDTTCDSGAGKCDASGNCVECSVASDCPGEDNACQTRTCAAGACGFSYQPSGHAIALQDPGDCKQNVCDGHGATVPQNDDTDLPDDQNPCTTDICTSGATSHGKASSGTACGTSLMCDDNGACVGCTTATDCPGTDSECQTRTCTTGTCGFTYADAGTVLTTQTAGDCQQSQCDGVGHVKIVALDTDTPADDGNACTGEACNNGFAVHPPKGEGTTCSSGVCDGSGACVACDIGTDCPGSDGDCTVRSCTAHVCGTANRPAGTVVQQQTAGDCQVRQCNATGGVISVADNGDLPPAEGACTTPVCDAGVPGHPAKADNTACDDGSACTQTDTCQSGVCTGGNPVICPPPADTCHTTGVCNPASGQCSTPQKADGAACSDNNACTIGETCQAGACTGGVTTVCPPPTDGCHDVGVCDAQTGACSNPAKNDGTSCSDGNACTQGDSCQAGTCTPGAAVPCTASDQCHVAGVCDPSTGCSNPAVSDGTSCDDANPCTTGDSCVAGACTGGTPKTCSPSDDCHTAGSCDGATGNCSNPIAHDGTSCNSGAGVCEVGACDPLPTVVTTAPADAAIGIGPTTSIVITFSTAMSPSSLTTKTTLDNGACSGAVQVSSDGFLTCVPLGAPTMNAANTVATFVPSLALSNGEVFQIRVTTAATSALGASLGSSFTTPAGFKTALPIDIVISQIYGGGGNSGTTYENDFIELHNRGLSAVSLSGWSVQYAGATGTTWSSTALGGVIQPGGYYLVQEGAGGGGTTALPMPDATGSINLGATGGKVALVSTGIAVLTGSCPTGWVDFVDFGAANCTEEGTPTAAPSNTTAVLRAGAGCTDTNVNGADFTVAPPNPRNSATAAAACGLIPPTLNETASAQGSGVDSEIDYCALISPTTIAVAAASTTDPILCEIYEAGLTDVTSGDTGAFDVEVGYGPLTSNPENQAGWTWVAAPFVSESGNNDRYQAPFTAPAAGSYAFTCRVKWHGRTSPTYCDIAGAGSNTGLVFDVTELGAMTTN